MTDTDLYDQDEDDEYVEEYESYREPRAGWVRKLLFVLVILFLLAIITAGVTGVWVMRQVDPPGDPGDEVALTIPRGSSTNAIGELLERRDIIASATVWRYYVRYKDAGGFQAGEYTFRENSSMGDVLAVLDDGPAAPPSVNVTIAEGLTLGQVAREVQEKLPDRSAEAFLAAAQSGEVRSKFQPPEVASLEGLLLPETYAVQETEDELALVRRMVGDLDRVATELGYDDAPNRVGLTPYQTIILASLVEAEAQVDHERPIVARVLYNRLAQDHPLELDATVYYALGRAPGDDAPGFDRNVDSPYNTYRNRGLPPTPIIMPGRASLAAAIAPDPGNWFYYVAVPGCTGEHVFAETLAEFNEARQAYLQDPC
jgi:UPF0755 protein